MSRRKTKRSKRGSSILLTLVELGVGSVVVLGVMAIGGAATFHMLSKVSAAHIDPPRPEQAQ